MFSIVQAIIFGALQGITELFPISSLGHSVLLPWVLHWNVNQQDPFFLLFLVATHTATATVLFLLYWKDWNRIIRGLLRSLKNKEISANDPDSKIGWLLIVATIPAGLLGVLFEDQLKNNLSKPQLVAGVLILNGLLLASAEFIRRKKKNVKLENSTTNIAKLSWMQAFWVGCLQCLALIPGFSRTGSTLTGGLLVGLSHEESAQFSFLLATPIIAAASLLKLPELITGGEREFLPLVLAGTISAAICSYLSVKFLTKYFKRETLLPFAIYCVSIGSILSFLSLFFR